MPVFLGHNRLSIIDLSAGDSQKQRFLNAEFETLKKDSQL
jgi:hypothetical protein